MNKKLFTVLVALILLGIVSLITHDVSAVTVGQSTYTCVANQLISINLTATPSDGTRNLLQLDLQANNLTITNFVAASGWDTTSNGPYCGGAAYTSSKACALLGMTGGETIESGQAIGTITVKCPTSGTGTLSKTTSNIYSSNSDEVPNTGTLATFTVSTTLPNTASSDDPVVNNVYPIFGIAIGLVLIILGFKYFLDRKGSVAA
jgi:hypothetical protein